MVVKPAEVAGGGIGSLYQYFDPHFCGSILWACARRLFDGFCFSLGDRGSGLCFCGRGSRASYLAGGQGRRCSDYKLVALLKTDIHLDPIGSARFGHLNVRDGKTKNAKRSISLT